MKLDFPAPYFGGKKRVASLVWKLLGDVRHYIEPCVGSGAVLLARPDYDPQKHVETINDADGFVTNVWRSLQLKPEETARFCKWPVNQFDMYARRYELMRREKELTQKLIEDPKFCDPELASYWIYCASCWIGSRMLDKGKNDLPQPGEIPALNRDGAGGGRNDKTGQIPQLSEPGKGVHRKSKTGQRPHFSHSGQGVHRKGQDFYYGRTNIDEWFKALSERLRYVRIFCGDWSRVCGGNWQNRMGVPVGIFFDPPYADEKRRINLYCKDSFSVAKDIAQWCLERGSNKDYRIILCGYEGNYPELIEAGWKEISWKSKGGYSNMAKNETSRKSNVYRERLFVSPYCNKIDMFW